MSRSQQLRRRRRGRGRRRNKILLTLMVLGIVAALGLGAVITYVVSIAATAPPLSSLHQRDPGTTSEVLAANGERLGFIQADTLRRPIPSSAIPKQFKQAIVAIEDERFYHHKGVDYVGVVRAAVKNLLSQKTVEGGSTITMQLVRHLYISGERTYARKIREAKLAQELEHKRDKDWILSMYANSVSFGTVGGQTAEGVEAASRMYFGKPTGKMTLDEMALLAGLVQAPTSYSPIRNPQAAMVRRNEVLSKMAQLGMISASDAQAAEKKKVKVKPSRYFTRRRESYFFDYVKDELIQQYGERTVKEGGLTIHTTIDLNKQRLARQAIKDRLGGAGPSSAIVTIEPKNGYIRAMASSSDYGQSVFNLAAQGRRQPGSTFKVMALMTALRKGVDPDSTHYVSRPFDVKDPKWGPIKVKTYGGTYGGSMSLTQATLRSDNTVYIQLALDVGPEEVKKTAEEMGITSPLEGLPAESLGGLKVGVSPLEMANAFATIASGGYRNRPTAITKIVFPDGHSELPEKFKVSRKRVFSDGVARKGTDILVKNIQAGTGRAAAIGCPAGGKTGTTDNFNDAWFVGFTPRLATAVWVGYPNAQIQMRNEFHGSPVAGATFPAEIWGEYMKAAHGSFCGDFPPPTTPFKPIPFFGKYSRGGGSSYDQSGAGTYAPTQPQQNNGPTPPNDGNGDLNTNPYQTPPQPNPQPNTGGADDNTQ